MNSSGCHWQCLYIMIRLRCCLRVILLAILNNFMEAGGGWQWRQDTKIRHWLVAGSGVLQRGGFVERAIQINGLNKVHVAVIKFQGPLFCFSGGTFRARKSCRALFSLYREYSAAHEALTRRLRVCFRANDHIDNVLSQRFPVVYAVSSSHAADLPNE